MASAPVTTATLAATPHHTDSHALLGAGLALAAFALNSTVDVILKLVAAGHPFYQVIAVNGSIAMLPVLLGVALTGGTHKLRTARLGRHLFRGCFGCAAAFLAVLAYAHIPLTDFYAIIFAGPIIATTLSALWLKEHIDWTRWLAIALGFGGILIITNPLGSNPTPDHHSWLFMGRLAALGSVTCYVIAMLMVRRMRHTESNLAFSFYGYCVTVGLAWLLLLALGGPPLQQTELLQLLLSGTMGGIGSICMMTAFQKAPVALVAPFQYTQIVWGAFYGWLIWHHLPDWRLAIGAVIVMASGLYVLYRELRVVRG
jgi:drug/metabolite transporter (DMT)-like permease